MSDKKTDVIFEDANNLPGYFIHHLQQISVAVFLRETEEFGVTPMQFAVLRLVNANPDIDQRSLASAAGLDASTTTGVIDRLEARKLVVRQTSALDRRVRQLRVTDSGSQLLTEILPSVLRAQRLMLEPLPEHERAEFVRMLGVLVAGNNELSRAPKKEVPQGGKQS